MNINLTRFLQVITSIAVMVLCSVGVMHAQEINAKESRRTLEAKLQHLFGDRVVEIRDYNQHFKEVVVETDFLFASHDGRYLFAGPVIDTQRSVDIRQERESEQRKSIINSQPKELFIRYPSTVEERFVLTVFTDIDCPYCRKLHNYIGALNQKGVTVDYIMVPRGGLGSAAFAKTLSAFCSEQPGRAITKMMRNEAVERLECDRSQLEQHVALARRLKISSTPSLVLPNGDIKLGLVSPDKLVEMLESLSINEKLERHYDAV